MQEKLKNILEEAKDQLGKASTLQDAEDARVKFLGKKGALTEILRSMGSLAPEERKELGQAANQVRAQIENMLAETGAALREKAREAKFRAETIDVTEPGKAPKLGAKHPITVTIEEISKLYIFCLEQNYIEAPESDEVYAMAGFIAGKFPTGDYFLKNGSITIDQLDVAIAEQRKNAGRGQHELIGKVLVKMGFLTEETVKTLFRLKADSRKRFVINPDLLPDSNGEVKNIKKLEEEIKALKDENKALKKTMAKIIDVVKNYDI